MIKKFAIIAAGVLFLLANFAAAGAQSKPAPAAEYSGADREQRLLAGAKSEGKVVWYTSLAGSSYKDLAKGFE